MAKILLLETATDVCSTALAVNGHVIAHREEHPTLQHAALLTLQIQACFEEAGLSLVALDAVAVSRGPGSYTGLRVGASVAKALCYALDKPLISIDTLQALASESRNRIAGAQPSTLFVSMLDARRQEVWLAAYDEDLQELAPAQPLVINNKSFHEFLTGTGFIPGQGRVILSGNGVLKLDAGHFLEDVQQAGVALCSAQHLAILAEKKFRLTDFEDIVYFEPLYMKPPNITSPVPRPLF